MSPLGGGLILAADTSTRASVVVVGHRQVLAISRRDVQHAHSAHLLEQIDEVLAAAGSGLDDVVGLAVGTGPGSFTGLRVGLATLKTIAYTRHLPLVGVTSANVLRRAGTAAGAPADAAVVLRAGAHDHYLARAGHDPALVTPGNLSAELGSSVAIAIDVDAAVLGEEASRLGDAALDGMAAALLALAHERFEAGILDDVAELVPAYVALPRGVEHAAEDLGWSPDLR